MDVINIGEHYGIDEREFLLPLDIHCVLYGIIDTKNEGRQDLDDPKATNLNENSILKVRGIFLHKRYIHPAMAISMQYDFKHLDKECQDEIGMFIQLAEHKLSPLEFRKAALNMISPYHKNFVANKMVELFASLAMIVESEDQAIDINIRHGRPVYVQKGIINFVFEDDAIIPLRRVEHLQFRLSNVPVNRYRTAHSIQCGEDMVCVSYGPGILLRFRGFEANELYQENLDPTKKVTLCSVELSAKDNPSFKDRFDLLFRGGGG
jgi:hypothetical protein